MPKITKWDELLSMHVDENPNVRNKFDYEVCRHRIKKWDELMQKMIKKDEE